MDEIVVKYDGDVKKLEDKLHALEADQLAIDKAAKKTTQTIGKESDKAAASVQKVNKNVSGLKDSFTNLANNLPFAGTIQQVTQLGNAFTGVTGSVGKTTGAMNVLKGAFSAIGIGAILTAFGSLIAYFKSTEAGADKLAKIMRIVGAVFGEVTKTVATLGGYLFDAGEALFDFVQGADIASKSTDDYKKSVIELGAEIADLQDRIEELTITLDLQNDKLQTGIENNLRKLRNRNIQLTESLGVIAKIGELEEKKLKNSTILIEEKLALERKDFLLKTQDFGADKQRIEELQHLALVGNESGKQYAKEELKRFDDIIAANKEKGRIFDQFVNGQIDASQLLDKAQGTFQQEDAKRIADILKQREAAVRESGNLEERLQNFKDAALDKDKLRQEKIAADEKARLDKIFNNALKQLDIQEKLAVGLAKIEGRNEGNLIAIQEEFNVKKLELFKDYGRQKTSEYQELLLGQKTLEKEYTDFLDKEDERRLNDQKAIDARKLKEEQEFLDEMKKLDEKAGEEQIALSTNVADEQLKKSIENAEKKKAYSVQAVISAIDISTQLLNSFNDLELARINANVSAERTANEEKYNSQIATLEKRNKSGLISDEVLASKKEKLQKEQAKKESALKKKQWQAEQNAALVRVGIEAAIGVAKAVASYLSNPLTAAAAPFVIGTILAQAAIQAAFIKAQPVPKFEEGGKVLQGMINGNSHKRGGVLIEAEGGERIFSKKTTAQYEPLLKSIQEGKFEKYAYENIARPALKRDQERRRKKELDSQNLMRMMSSNDFDTSHLERLTKSNKNVNIGNVKALASELASVLQPKSSKGL